MSGCTKDSGSSGKKHNTLNFSLFKFILSLEIYSVPMTVSNLLPMHLTAYRKAIYTQLEIL